ncbi:hypothetical protein [Methylophaga pinxianii]|uniref:hypothetical protein n=1 Tax=Methylophaga pinxianii TaxID=2881052 RepID=UPI001CF12F84|nr:hypothetical protein [Methylophaga pinxianii]MCB2426952.1 hypothetical protein [Methylophaga pinxianii]UPH44842.1 hypothetical protein LGT42_009990 [Methylophaga pinxianii]
MQSIKNYLVWIGLAITLLMVYLVEQQEDDIEAVEVRAPESVQVQPLLNTQIDTTNEDVQLRTPIIETPKNLFAVPQIAEPELAVDPQPSQPVMPANPYIYVGKLIEDGEMRVFLTNGQKNYVVKTGDTLEDTWQVKSIESTEMILVNLPTQTQVSVKIGALL